MQPGKVSVISLFNTQSQYVIPVFQRGYVWTLDKQVGPLWADIEDRALKLIEHSELAQQTGTQFLKPLQKHFLGSLVLTPVEVPFGRVPTYEVIDGQQRTTTLHLLMLAFRHAAQQLNASAVPQMLDALLRNPGPYTAQSDHHKVWPTQAGREEMAFLDQAQSCQAVCDAYPARGGKDGKERMERPLMVQAYLYLYHACLAYLRGATLDDPAPTDSDRTRSDALVRSIRNDNTVSAVCADLPLQEARAEMLFTALRDHVQIMTLTLEAEDDPQVIFETLNARGEPLQASDLIRNFVFLELTRRGQAVDSFYKQYWQDFDEQRDHKQVVTANRYWRERERQGRITYPRVDLFFYHYTVLRRQQETMVSHVFHGFKEWWQCEPQRDIQAELERIVQAREYFRSFISPKGEGFIAEFGRLIKALDVGTLTPIYLLLRERLDVDDSRLKQALSDLASYVVRRAVCGYTTKNYNRVFLRLLTDVVHADEPAAALRASLLKLQGHSQEWPSDREFSDAWMDRPVYRELRPARVVAILRALELGSRTSKQESSWAPVPETLTIEHVLPQEWESGRHYPLPQDDEDARLRRNRLIQTFGNLTLLTQPLNSSVSNGPFLDLDQDGKTVLGKRSGFLGSLLVLNAYFLNRGNWLDEDIRQRGQGLLALALKIWPKPE